MSSIQPRRDTRPAAWELVTDELSFSKIAAHPTDPTYEMPELSQLTDFDFAADGDIWAATLNEVVRHPPI